MNRAPSELLELMAERHRLADEAYPTGWHFTVPAEHAIERAARRHAEANNADPFAYARIKHYLRRGLARVPEVLAEAQGILNARHHARNAVGVAS